MQWPQCQDLSSLSRILSASALRLSSRLRHLLKLQKWSRKITSILDLDELIDHVVNDVSCAFGCVETNLYLHDAEHGELEAAGVHGCTLHGKGSRLKDRQGRHGRIRRRHLADALRARCAQDPYYIACEESTLSEVAIPLLVDGKLVGVFSASHHELDAFPREQLRMLQGLCDHLAVAVHNARRFQHERHERERMSLEETRGPRDPAGFAAQEFAVHPRLRHFRTFHPGRRRGR